MRVLIIGYGAVGSVLAKLLIKEKSVEKIYCIDLKFFEILNNKKIIFEKLNILDEENFVNYLKSVKPDVAINTSLPKFNLNIMKCCLKAKVNYLDTAAFWALETNPGAKVPYNMEQLRYQNLFKSSKIKGMIESGVAPGLDNLLVAECASELEEVDYIKIRMVEDTGSKKVFFSWNKDWLLDEIASKPIIYENGKWKFVPYFGAEEEFEFPKPIGKKKTYYFCQDEVGSIPFHIRTKKLDVKIHDNNIDLTKKLLAEIESGKKVEDIAKTLPDPVPGEEKNFPKSVFAISIEVIGKKFGKKKSIKHSIVFPNQNQIGKMNLGANFISYPTALSASLFVRAIPLIKNYGVFPPEALDKKVRKFILKNLAKHKIKIIKESYVLK